MLYLQSTDKELHIVILETANLDELRKGRPARTPDEKVLIAWTPDPVWLADKIMDSGGDALAISKLIDEAAKRPQKPPRPHHEPFETKFSEDQ